MVLTDQQIQRGTFERLREMAQEWASDYAAGDMDAALHVFLSVCVPAGVHWTMKSELRKAYRDVAPAGMNGSGAE